MKVSYRQDEDFFWVNAINQTIRKTLQKIAPICAFVDRPQPWKFLDLA